MLIVSLFVDEFKVWEAVARWIQAPSHPERRGATATPMITQILPLIRYELKYVMK